MCLCSPIVYNLRIHLSIKFFHFYLIITYIVQCHLSNASFRGIKKRWKATDFWPFFVLKPIQYMLWSNPTILYQNQNTSSELLPQRGLGQRDAINTLNSGFCIFVSPITSTIHLKIHCLFNNYLNYTIEYLFNCSTFKGIKYLYMIIYNWPFSKKNIGT